MLMGLRISEHDNLYFIVLTHQLFKPKTIKFGGLTNTKPGIKNIKYCFLKTIIFSIISKWILEC